VIRKIMKKRVRRKSVIITYQKIKTNMLVSIIKHAL